MPGMRASLPPFFQKEAGNKLIRIRKTHFFSKCKLRRERTNLLRCVRACNMQPSARQTQMSLSRILIMHVRHAYWLKYLLAGDLPGWLASKRGVVRTTTNSIRESTMFKTILDTALIGWSGQGQCPSLCSIVSVPHLPHQKEFLKGFHRSLLVEAVATCYLSSSTFCL